MNMRWSALQVAPQQVKFPLPLGNQPLCPVKVGQRGREKWCMRTLLETSDCKLQETCSETSHVMSDILIVDVDSKLFNHCR